MDEFERRIQNLRPLWAHILCQMLLLRPVLRVFLVKVPKSALLTASNKNSNPIKPRRRGLTPGYVRPKPLLVGLKSGLGPSPKPKSGLVRNTSQVTSTGGRRSVSQDGY
jgi:hypothetical protein